MNSEEAEYEELIAQLQNDQQAKEYLEASFAHYEAMDDLESFLAVVNAIIAGRYKGDNAPKKVLEKLGFKLSLTKTEKKTVAKLPPKKKK